LFPALGVLALMFPLAKKTRFIYAALTGTCFVNLAYVLYFLNTNQAISGGDFVALTVTLINLLVFVLVLVMMWDELKGRSWLSTSPARTLVNSESRVNENENRN
jgi:peptidoglycan/LPS O-acetylase OafA/YrhL